jgi:hypothetical protein
MMLHQLDKLQDNLGARDADDSSQVVAAGVMMRKTHMGRSVGRRRVGPPYPLPALCKQQMLLASVDRCAGRISSCL